MSVHVDVCSRWPRPGILLAAWCISKLAVDVRFFYIDRVGVLVYLSCCCSALNILFLCPRLDFLFCFFFLLL